MKKEKLKENPMIGKQKRVKIKNRKFDVTEDTNEVKTFIIILAVIIIIVGVIYFVTEITELLRRVHTVRSFRCYRESKSARRLTSTLSPSIIVMLDFGKNVQMAGQARFKKQDKR